MSDRVQGRRYKDEWTGCACSLDLSVEQPRYVCADCGGTGKVGVDTDTEAQYQRARRTGRWEKRCGHCSGAGWHP